MDIDTIIELWEKPYGKIIVILLSVLVVFILFDFLFLSGQNVQYESHPLNSPVEINIASADIKYRVSISIGNKESKYAFKYSLKNPDGLIVINDEDSYRRNKRSFVFTPEETGVYQLKIQSVHGGGPPSVMVSVDKNDRSIIAHRLR